MDSFNNITFVEKDNYNITPENVKIWNDELPYKTGDKFPTDDIIKRASEYETYRKLYYNDYSEVFNITSNFKSFQQDLISYTELYDLVTSLPDFKNCTETWVDLIAANPPRIDGENENIEKLSTILTNSNFSEHFKSAVRGALIMYGNKVFRVEKMSGGQSRIIDMKLSNWIPFVNKLEPTIIDVNVFFNIIDNDNNSICEFIEYHENGDIIKTTFEYNANTHILGDIVNVEKSKAFNGLGISPIIVYSGNKIDDEIFGKSLYPNWDSSIASSMRAYENMMTMLEKNKEALLVAPEYSSDTIDGSDMQIVNRKGSILYKEGQTHDVNWVSSNLNIQDAINVYKETLIRLSRDTDLSITFFDGRELGAQVSAKALRASMYKTELKAYSRISEIEVTTKQLIVKLALANGIEIGMDDFSLITNVGFIQDDEEQMKIIQARNGNAVTMTVEDSIAEYEGISIKRAKRKADELLNRKAVNVEDEEDVNVSSSGESSEVSDNVVFTSEENIVDDKLNNKNGNKFRRFMSRFFI